MAEQERAAEHDGGVFYPEPFVRPTALCVIRRGGEILVQPVLTPEKASYRPLGGGIEYGEYAANAAVREMREELGVGVANLKFLGTRESVYVHRERPGHEILFLFEADFLQAELYRRDVIEGREANGLPLHASWKPLAEFREGREALFPDGLLDLLAKGERQPVRAILRQRPPGAIAEGLHPRAVARCVFARQDAILLVEVPDADVPGWLPLGGTIEFGELAEAATAREIREELGVELTGLSSLGVIESLFTYHGQLGHEIVFAYEARLPDPSFYQRGVVHGVESDGSPIRAFWKPLADFERGRTRLYPDGLLLLLTGKR